MLLASCSAGRGDAMAAVWRLALRAARTSRGLAALPDRCREDARGAGGAARACTLAISLRSLTRRP